MQAGELAARLQSGDAVVAGVMSGTSGDGVDVALMRPRFEPGADGGDWRLAALETLAFETVPFDDAVPGLGGEVRGWLDAATHAGPVRALADLARFDAELGRAFGLAVRYVAEKAGFAPELIGSHGQTVWHHDGKPPRATLQLGDGCQLAEVAGASVVSDFRRADIAAGGEGAPIAAHVDGWLLGAEPKWVLNLGGISNLALMAGGRVQLSFDTGPAGALLDGLARKLLGTARDQGGAVAAEGFAHAWQGRAGGAAGPRLEVAFETVLDLDVHGTSLRAFAGAALPKSTGREAFGGVFVEALLARAKAERWPKELVLAAAVEAVAWCVAAGVEAGQASANQAAGQSHPLFVAGGGVHNRALMASLRRHLLEGGARPVMASSSHHDDPAVAAPVELVSSVATTRALGVDPDAREALAFALLACAHVLGQPLPLGDPQSAQPTGATRRVIPGKFSPGP